MARIESLKFAPLELDGSNYDEWAADMQDHLTANGLLTTIDSSFEMVSAAEKEKGSQALIFILRHCQPELKSQLRTSKNPSNIWKLLNGRFELMKAAIKPKALHEWGQLRFQDFKTVQEYTRALFDIVNKLRRCGCTSEITEEALINKTLTTFHASNSQLMLTYFQRKFKEYNDLLQALLFDEQMGNLLQFNHDLRPTGSAPAPFGKASIPSASAPTELHATSNSTTATKSYPREHRKFRDFQDGRIHQRSRGNRFTSSRVSHHDHGIECYRCGKRDHTSSDCFSSQRSVDAYNRQRENDRTRRKQSYGTSRFTTGGRGRGIRHDNATSHSSELIANSNITSGVMKMPELYVDEN